MAETSKIERLGALPGLGYPVASYITGLRAMAWGAAGWAAGIDDEMLWVWGPVSIRGSIDADILDLTGCLDARAGRLLDGAEWNGFPEGAL